MATVTRLVNFVRESSSLQHRLFRSLLEEMSSEHKDLLLHNDIRWLSKGRVLERVCDLRDELVSFLSSLQRQKAHELSFLTDTKVIADVNFLCDIMSHLNHLNLQLQGKNHTVAEMYEVVEAFRSKLHLLERDIHGRKLHFPRLREHCEKNEMPEDPTAVLCVSRRAVDWRGRKAGASIEEGALQMEVLEMGSSELLKAQHKDAPVCDFWISVVPQARFKNTRAIAMFLLTMFPSTYICESGFSSMNAIKSQDRNRLSSAHLGQCLRIATTEYKPNITQVASSCRSHFSH
ncbi:hypothetical protein JOQ06_007721 [Pogonophryne albipinna]|uniref:HAT C-terminal dimerisation domain-containing protein n=1 Tax=Pogonophryne albipinna TaxID=1090488 RepID=A0AAD6B3F6_9TELE|nr:hypothetical protein JOQ06_007721 [Pogonophryne albipinna]